jgi:flagellar basal-body rod protein FlgB
MVCRHVGIPTKQVGSPGGRPGGHATASVGTSGILWRVHTIALEAQPGTVLASERGNACPGRVIGRGIAQHEESHVNELTDAAVMSALRRQLSFAAAKQVVASSNLANVNTPGYKAKQVNFSDALTRSLAGGPTLATTNAKHIGGANDMGVAATTEVPDAPARRDGNTVQIDRELLNMTNASGDFTEAQTALAAKFRLVRYAISEGR